MPVGLAIDTQAQKLYFSNRDAGTIIRSNLDGTGIQTVFSSSSRKVFDIDLDFTNGKMYFATTTQNVPPILGKIQRANFDGSNIEDIFSSTNGEAIGIAVDPLNNHLYWTEPLNHKIRRSNLNGTNVTDIVATGLDNPQFLTLVVVPEPGSLGLTIAGFGLLFCVPRRLRSGAPGYDYTVSTSRRFASVD